MKSSKLVRIILSLSQEEIAGFKKFAQSKTFNNNNKLLVLFKHVCKQLKVKRPDFSDETSFQKLFGNQPYDYFALRHQMSYLVKLLERFLAFNELYSNSHVEALALCRAYRKRNMPKQFESTIRKTKNKLLHSPKRNIDHHTSVFQLEMNAYLTKVLEKRVDNPRLQEVNDQLDITYFAQKLRQCCLMIAQQNVSNAEFDLGIANGVIQEVDRKKLYQIPAIGIYYFTYKAQLKSNDIQVFKNLQKQLITYTDLFEPIELGQSYLLAINIGIKLLNQGEISLMKEILELYKTGIESRILLFNDLLSRFTYKNTITLGIRLGEYDWVSTFISTYKDLLDPRFKEESFHYGLAHLYYAQKKYEDALKLLFLNVKSDDVFMNLSSKVLLTRIFYEQNEIDSLEAQINSFKTFIRRRNMISYQRPHYNNFINTVNKLIRLNPYDRQAKQQLKLEIEHLQPLPVKYWFLEQVS